MESARRAGPVEYVVDREITDRKDAATVCEAILDVVGDRLSSAVIDAYTDYDHLLTSSARQAQQRLMELGEAQGGRRDPGLGILLDLSEPLAWDLLRRFAPWSINVDLCDAEDHEVANFHDCAHVTSASLLEDEAAALSARLLGVAPVVRARRRAERMTFLRELLAKLSGG